MTLMPYIKQRWTDANGLPLAGGKIYSYAATTATPLATYTDQGGLTQNPNPMILDANGEASIWLSTASYKFVVKDSLNNILYTVDKVQLVPDDSIDKSKIAADVAGNGLSQAVDGSLDVNVDDATLEINSDTLRVKALGIDTAQIKNDAITTPKILDANITTPKIADGAITLPKLAALNKVISGPVYGNMTSTSLAQAIADSNARTENIATIVRASNVVTVSITGNFTYTVGSTIIITGTTGTITSMNGAFTVASTVAGSTTTVTFAQTGSNESGTSATGTISDYVFLNGYGTQTCNSIVRASNVVTVTTTFAHNLEVGQIFTIKSSTGGATSFNGTFVVASVPSTTTLTFAQTGADESANAKFGVISGWLGVQITTSGRPVMAGLTSINGISSNLLMGRNGGVDVSNGAGIRLQRKTGSSTPSSASDFSKQWIFDQTNFTFPNSVNVTGVSRSSNVCTATTGSAHGLSIGAIIGLLNCGVFDGVYVIKTVPSGTTFTYENVGVDGSSGVVTGTCYKSVAGRGIGTSTQWLSPAMFQTVDFPPAGTYTYFFAMIQVATDQLVINQVGIFAYEL